VPKIDTSRGLSNLSNLHTALERATITGLRESALTNDVAGVGLVGQVGIAGICWVGQPIEGLEDRSRGNPNSMPCESPVRKTTGQPSFLRVPFRQLGKAMARMVAWIHTGAQSTREWPVRTGGGLGRTLGGVSRKS